MQEMMCQYYPLSTILIGVFGVVIGVILCTVIVSNEASKHMDE